jgi:hypothetical protein
MSTVKRPAKPPASLKCAAAEEMELTAPNILAYLQTSQKQFLSKLKPRKVSAKGSAWAENWRRSGSALRKMSRLYRFSEFSDGVCIYRAKTTSGKLPSPAQLKTLLRRVVQVMRQAVLDCRALDFCCAHSGKAHSGKAHSGKAMAYLEKLDFNKAGVLISLNCLIMAQRRRKQKTPREAGQIKLHQIEALIRDGIPADLTLALYSFATGETLMDEARKGNAAFFIALGSKLAKLKPAQRPLTDWILRAWLPLRLWQCPADGRKAHDRFCRAWRLLERTPPDWLDFVNGWNNVRTRFLRSSAQAQPLVNNL